MSARLPALLALLGGLLFVLLPLEATAYVEDPDVSDAQIQDAMRRGVDFLVREQKKDGSWGSPAPTLSVDIYAPGKGSQDAFKVGSCGLALAGMIDASDGRPEVERAIRKAADWLILHHEAKRDRADVIYNTWAHAHALEAFGRLLEREKDPARRDKLRTAAARAVDRLVRYEFVDGGWGYYDFGIGTQKPSYGGATSFTTAAALVGLARAAAQGVLVPSRIVRRAKALIRRCRLPGGAYMYSFKLNFNQPWGVNKPQGSLARTPACIAALLAQGDPVPMKQRVLALDALEKDGRFLRIARKYPVPHETWYQNSGYFCFYGYYYASRLLEDVGSEKRAFHRRRIAAHLLPLQEPGGAWWDYQLYRHHKIYGTGYVLMALANCMIAANPDAASPDEAVPTPEPSTDR